MYCQKCRTPLHPSNSLDNLNPAAFDILVGAVDRSPKSSSTTNLQFPRERKDLYNATTQRKQDSLFRRSVPTPREGSGTDKELNRSISSRSRTSMHNPGMSFVEITESQIVHSEDARDYNSKTADIRQSGDNKLVAKDESFSWELNRHEKLFAILSSNSDIDHPICVECSSMLISQFNVKLSLSTRERDSYASFLKSLQQSSAQMEDVKANETEVEDLVAREEAAYRELLQLEEEKQALDSELAHLEEESRKLDDQERAFWEHRNSFNSKLHNVEGELTSLQEKYAHDQGQLEKLQRTNVYNDTFCIGHDGHFGTINGLRLGRLSTQNVEWAEINAAWGQTLLLLATVAEKLGFVFENYRLRPLGSTSRIEKVEWPRQSPDEQRAENQTQRQIHPPAKVIQLDLFSSGVMPLGRVFNHRRFDAGMVAFLECLSQVGKHVEKASRAQTPSYSSVQARSSPLTLPYTIQGDKIGDVSIRLGVGFSQDENFTKACKYTLTCCKFLLAHVSNLESHRG